MQELGILQSQAGRVAQYEAEGDNLAVVNTNAYFSVGRLTATRTGTTPNFSYVVPAGQEIRLFGYGRGQSMAAAGFAPTITATEADTNIQNASQTIDGETVEIQGVAFQILPTSDFYIAKHLAPVVSCKISLNGGDRGRILGPLDMQGGGTGLFGSASSQALQGVNIPFAANGYPVNSNCTPLPERLLWKPAGQTDSTLVIVCRVERAITLLATLNAELPAVQPNEVYVDIRARLFSMQKSARSQNM